MTGPTRAVLLGRVSTSEERRDPSTGKVVRKPQDPENQLVPLREHAARLGWKVIAEVPLPGLSAWDEVDAIEVQRRILAPFEEGQADVLMVWSLDRVVRGGIFEAFRFLRRLEKDLGVGFWSLREPFLNTTADPQSRELMLALLSWIAKWESQRRSDRLKAKAAANRNRAAGGGGRAIWGRGKMATQGDIARMAELKLAGRTYRQISAELGLALGTVGHHLRGVHPRSDERRDGSGSAEPHPVGLDLNRG